MYNTSKIIIGIIIFVLLFTAPIWTNMFNSGDAKIPNLKYPEKYTKCVMDKKYMIENHMDLLNQWRDKVVRQDIRMLKINGKPFLIDGKPAEMSLTKTCLKCHSEKKDFCDQCHNYLDVKPYCWDCHVDKFKESQEGKDK